MHGITCSSNFFDQLELKREEAVVPALLKLEILLLMQHHCGIVSYLAFQVFHCALQLRDVCLHLRLALLCGERLAHAKCYAALIQCLQGSE